MSRVAILGAGVMRSALSFPLADNGHQVHLVGTHLDREIIDSVRHSGLHPGLNRQLPDSVRPHQLDEIGEAFYGADVVLSGVNSFGVAWAGQQMAPLLKRDMLVIAIAKGMDSTPGGDLRILPEVLAEQVAPELRAEIPWAAIAGPSIAGELAARRTSCVVFTGRDQAALDRLASMFRTPYYHVWTSTDFVGVEVCAAMKNCYALGVGFAEGILDRLGEAEAADRNYNYAAALFAQASVEMRQMLRVLGGQPETASWLPGVGDMYVTSQGGGNIRVGRLVGGGLRFSEARARMAGITLEGAAAIQVIGAALARLTERGVIGQDDFPLMRHLHAVVGEDQPLDMPWTSFFAR
jgi:glycerol-3-phosphate dehydrogenase (NAD(P)+)